MSFTVSDIILPVSAVVSTASRESVSNIVHQAVDGASATIQTTTSQDATYYPVTLQRDCTLYKFMTANNGVAGNIDVGLYRPNYTKVVSTGVTAMSGASTYQLIDVTDTYVPAGAYYLALWTSAGPSFRAIVAGNLTKRLVLRLKESSLASGLPTTMTPVAFAATLGTPVFGFTTIPTF